MILVGQKFNKLKVLEVTNQKQQRSRMVLCECECGTQKLVRSDHLKSGRTRSCGGIGCRCYVDLSGKTFGYLTCLQRSQERKGNNVLWVCRCVCDKEVAVAHYSLTSGQNTSCGCMKGTKQSERCRQSLIGQRFGKIVVMKESDQKKGRRKLYECKCDCGKSVLKTSRMARNYQSCGCLKNELLINRITTHGESKTRKYKNFHRMKRIASIMHRTPKWANFDRIKEIYKNCPDGYTVDHIVPLQGKKVSGLHVAENLQYLTQSDNSRKGNRFECGALA